MTKRVPGQCYECLSWGQVLLVVEGTEKGHGLSGAFLSFWRLGGCMGAWVHVCMYVCESMCVGMCACVCTFLSVCKGKRSIMSVFLNHFLPHFN